MAKPEASLSDGEFVCSRCGVGYVKAVGLCYECDGQVVKRENWKDWHAPQTTIDELPALHVVDEAQRAALPILAAHVEWWLHSQNHEPMPHPADVLEDAVRAADGAR